MAAAAIPKPLLDLVAQTAGHQQVPSSYHIRPVVANLDSESSGAGIPLVVVVDLNKLNPKGPERRHNVAVEAISESVPYSSSRADDNAWGENIHRAIQRCVHKLGCPSPSYCLPITVNDPSPYGSETESPFSPFSFILEKNNVKVEVITNKATTDEDVSKFDLATIAGALSLFVPMAIHLDELTTNWGALWKVLCGIFMIMSLMSALIGLFTTSFRAGSRARNLSSHCARMSFLVATIVFVLLIASKLGCVGCVIGLTLVLVMLVLTILWIRNEKATSDRVLHEI